MKKNPTGKLSQPEQGNSDKGASQAAVEALFPGRRAETKLEFPTGRPDLDALRSVTREWLVPLLVEKFLLEQGVELRARPKVCAGGKPISEL